MTNQQQRPQQIAALEQDMARRMEAHDYEGAVEVGKELLKLAPRHMPAYDTLGSAYFLLGDAESALRVAGDLVRISPHEPRHVLQRALLFEHTGRIEAAVEELGRVMAMAPSAEEANSAREHLEALDSYQINQILLLASDDRTFRLKLERYTEGTIRERGYYLSERGLEALRDLCEEGYLNSLPPTGPARYH